ncbi:MAG: PQQ-like beta-propeller repeat protein [Bacteroidales bacterium]|nr:PQQ-like beta-propeller repeat protein [Bacteroidales bacterium]
MLIRVLAITLMALAAPAVFADDWPQWMGPNRDGVWAETGILQKFPAGGPKVLWKQKVGMGYSGPAIAQGKVFVTDRVLNKGQANPDNPFDRDTAVGGVERVLCLDAQSGKLLWKHEYPSAYKISYAAGPRCVPAVDGDRVYTLGAMGDLLCLNTSTGQVVWSKNGPKDFGAEVPLWGFSSPPLIDGDNLICLIGGTDGRLVMAFDKKTGAEKWKSLTFASGDFGYAPPVIYDLAGQRTLVIWHPKALVGLNPDTGSQLWSVPFEVRAALTAPMPRRVGTDSVFVTSFYNGAMLVKVTPTGAKPVWVSKAKGEKPNQTRDLSSIIPTPLIQNDHVYGIGSYGELRCLEARTGKRLWATNAATRGRLTPERIREREEPNEVQPWNERWANAFLVANGDKYFLFNEQGELVIAQLTPQGYTERDRAVLLNPTNKMAGRPVVWTHPAYANKCCVARNDEEIVCVSLAE